jgi:methyltransferase (TIGR00027 family)
LKHPRSCSLLQRVFDHVADTALWVAAYRAIESARPDALFHDPFAERLAGERGRELAREVLGSRNFAWSIVVRTRVIDELLGEAIERGANVVVNLGAGMDARPHRLSLPRALRWIEVDGARVMALKEERLPATGAKCKLERVTLDLADDAGRRAFLGALEGDVVVLTEGVIGYLSNEDVAALARDLRARPAIRRWIVDFSSPMLQRAMKRRPRVRRQFRNAPFRFEPGDWTQFFERAGWKVESRRYLVEAGARLGRPVPLPLHVRLLLKIASQERREMLRHMMGYAVLV